VEDWRRLIEKAITRRYPLADGSGRTMPVRLTACDSGGKEGVTARAYEFFRELRAKGLHGKFRLVKGTDRIDAPRVVESFPDTRNRSDRNAGSAGDVPVLLLNSTLLKDDVMGKVWRTEDGPGRFHFPNWLPTSFYDELTAETRGDRRWEDHGRPNESLDLSCYAEAAALFMKADRIDWSAPPSWAAEWDKNPDVYRPGDEPGRPNDTQITRRKSNYW
jgi:phage terminase large subunit GpA-like protein